MPHHPVQERFDLISETEIKLSGRNFNSNMTVHCNVEEITTAHSGLTNFEQSIATLTNCTGVGNQRICSEAVCKLTKSNKFSLDSKCNHYTVYLSFFGGLFKTEKTPTISASFDQPEISQLWPTIIRTENPDQSVTLRLSNNRNACLPA